MVPTLCFYEDPDEGHNAQRFSKTVTLLYIPLSVLHSSDFPLLGILEAGEVHPCTVCFFFIFLPIKLPQLFQHNAT